MKFRMAPWGIGTVLLTAVFAAPAECLMVESDSVDEQETRYGITTAEWKANIRNSCDVPYDANITVLFKDADGRVLHQAVQFVAVRSGYQEDTQRRVNIPEDQFQAIDKVEVSIDERERPR